MSVITDNLENMNRKRDMNLLKAIMLNAERSPAGQPITGFEYPDIEQVVVMDHVSMLVNDLDFLDGRIVLGAQGEPYACLIQRITNKGHDFIEYAMNDNIWNKVMAEINKQAVPVSVGVVLAMLKHKTSELLGLPKE